MINLRDISERVVSLQTAKYLYTEGHRYPTNYVYVTNSAGYSVLDEAYRHVDSKHLVFPAYDTLHDICLRYAKRFFGDELLCYDCGVPVKPPLSTCNMQIGTGTCACQRQFENNLPKYEFIALQILSYLHSDSNRWAEGQIVEHLIKKD